MQITYDPDADVLYVRLREGRVADTTAVDADDPKVTANVVVDLDENDDVLGFEITAASTLSGLDPSTVSLKLLTGDNRPLRSDDETRRISSAKAAE